MRARAFQLVCESMPDGITCEEAEQLSGSKHQSMSPRFTDLANDDPNDLYRPHWPGNIPPITPSGRTRLTQSGYEAIVWIVNPAWEAHRAAFLERLDGVAETVERRRRNSNGH
jgi:hypothetical protein